jgi:hypothetical protein
VRVSFDLSTCINHGAITPQSIGSLSTASFTDVLIGMVLPALGASYENWRVIHVKCLPLMGIYRLTMTTVEIKKLVDSVTVFNLSEWSGLRGYFADGLRDVSGLGGNGWFRW